MNAVILSRQSLAGGAVANIHVTTRSESSCVKPFAAPGSSTRSAAWLVAISIFLVEQIQGNATRTCGL